MHLGKTAIRGTVTVLGMLWIVLFGTCAGGRAFLVVSVSDLTQETVALQVDVTADDLYASERFDGAPSNFVLYLPEGAAGPVVVYVDALLTGGCAVARGRGEATIVPGGRTDVSVVLIREEPMPLCRLTITRVGAGGGSVVGSQSINCTAPVCTQYFNPGAMVSLSAVPNDASYFSGWSGACKSMDQCMPNINGPVQVTAQFNICSGCSGKFSELTPIFSRACTFSACHSDTTRAGGMSLVGRNAYCNLTGQTGGATNCAPPICGPNAKTDFPRRVTPGDRAKSFLYKKLTLSDAEVTGGTYGSRMPLTGMSLEQREIDSFAKWIDQGAKDDTGTTGCM